MKKKILRPLVIALFAAVLIFAFLQLFGAFFMKTAFPRINPQNAPDSLLFEKDLRPAYSGSDPIEILNRDQKEVCHPILKEISQRVSVKSFDNLTLNAYLATHPKNHNYAIIMHGFRDSPKVVSPYALHFYQKGFNILVPGQRGHGWSEGSNVDMSAFTPRDVKTWAEYICSIDGSAKILLWGISMGGSTVMQATALDLPQNVSCCIEDCGFSSIWEEFSYQMRHSYHVPVHPLLDWENFYIKKHLGIDCKKVSAKEAVARSKIPTLFIHGSGDDYVPFYMMDLIYDAAACPKEKLVIENARHARSAFTEPERYWTAIDDFLEKYFYGRED